MIIKPRIKSKLGLESHCSECDSTGKNILVEPVNVTFYFLLEIALSMGGSDSGISAALSLLDAARFAEMPMWRSSFLL